MIDTEKSPEFISIVSKTSEIDQHINIQTIVIHIYRIFNLMGNFKNTFKKTNVSRFFNTGVTNIAGSACNDSIYSVHNDFNNIMELYTQTHFTHSMQIYLK